MQLQYLLRAYCASWVCLSRRQAAFQGAFGGHPECSHGGGDAHLQGHGGNSRGDHPTPAQRELCRAESARHDSGLCLHASPHISPHPLQVPPCHSCNTIHCLFSLFMSCSMYACKPVHNHQCCDAGYTLQLAHTFPVYHMCDSGVAYHMCPRTCPGVMCIQQLAPCGCRR